MIEFLEYANGLLLQAILFLFLIILFVAVISGLLSAFLDKK